LIRENPRESAARKFLAFNRPPKTFNG